MIGTKNQTRKLTLDDVRVIREEYEAGATQGSLAKYFGVSVGQIGRIVRGESWMEAGKVGVATQAVIDRSQAKVMAMLAEGEMQDKDTGAALPPTQPATYTAPPSPLDDERDMSDGLPPTGLSALQQRAAKYGLDIEKLLATKTEEN